MSQALFQKLHFLKQLFYFHGTFLLLQIHVQPTIAAISQAKFPHKKNTAMVFSIAVTLIRFQILTYLWFRLFGLSEDDTYDNISFVIVKAVYNPPPKHSTSCILSYVLSSSMMRQNTANETRVKAKFLRTKPQRYPSRPHFSHAFALSRPPYG